MADIRRSDAAAEDAKVREEWQRLERQRIADEIAEAREDGGAANPVRRGPGVFVWVALALALVAGIVVTAIINGVFEVNS